MQIAAVAAQLRSNTDLLRQFMTGEADQSIILPDGREYSTLAGLVASTTGPTAPAMTWPGRHWWDNSNDPPVLKIRDEADTGWITIDFTALAAVVHFANVASAAASDLTGTERIWVDGAAYRRVTSEPAHPGKIQSADGSWWEMVLDGPVSVARFGAKGDGITDDTQAFRDAIAFVTGATTAFTGVPDTSHTVDGCALYLPPGRYVVNLDTPISFEPDSTLHIRSDGMQAAEIVNQGSGYILTALDANHLAFRGFRMRGGAGFLKLTGTGNNVRRHFFVEDVGFYNYSECAIGHNSQDMPFWKIRDCDVHPNVQHGGAGTGHPDAIGFALNGLTDQVEITGCNFIGCKYAIKIGYGGNNAKIWSNFFAGPQNSNPGACIWVVPRPDGSAVNAGTGLDVDSNKFGNEGAVAGHKRILFADEDSGSGSDFLGRHHSTALSNNYIQGLSIRSVMLSGSSANAAGLIYSYLWRVGGVKISGIFIEGEEPAEPLVTFAPVAVAAAQGVGRTKGGRIDLSLDVSSVRGAVGTTNTAGGLIPSNLPWMFTVLDPEGLAQGRPGVPSFWPLVPNDPSFVSRFNLNISTETVSGAATHTRIGSQPDPDGGTDAAEFTFATANSYIGKTVTTPPDGGETAWIDFFVKRAAVAPVEGLAVTVVRDGAFELVRVVGVSAKWQRITLPFLFSGAAGTVQLVFEPEYRTFAAGTRDRVLIFRPQIYESTRPVA